ncbi:MAG: DUF3466 family protein [Phycisphaerae bacterium]|jgi:probable HAF family extracellular repeat protein
MRNKSVFVLFVLTMLLIANPASADVSYNIIDLGTLPGYETSRAWCINNNGQIVGFVDALDNFKEKAVLFDATGGGNNIDLGTLGGENSFASSINNNGQIVGGAMNSASPDTTCATIFDASGEGVNTSLGKGFANSINNNDLIVGASEGKGHAVLFDPTGQGDNTDLGTLEGYLYSEARSINNNGVIVGYSFSSGDSRATLFSPNGQGSNIDLGTLGGQSSAAVSINDNGQIVGRASTGANESRWFDHAAIFDPDYVGDNIDLGTLDEFDGSVALSINNKGQIVGQAWKWNVQCNWGIPLHAVLFDPTGSGNNIDLNDLINPDTGWELESASCINDNGWIVGFGTNPDSYRRAFLLTPVPEADTFLFLALGAVFLRKINR